MTTNTDQINKLNLKRKLSLARLREIRDYANNNTGDQFYRENLLARAGYLDPIYEEFQVIHNENMSLITTDAEFET